MNAEDFLNEGSAPDGVLAGGFDPTTATPTTAPATSSRPGVTEGVLAAPTDAARLIRSRYLSYGIDRDKAAWLLRKEGVQDPQAFLGEPPPDRPWWGGAAEFFEPEQPWRLQVRRRLSDEARARGDVRAAAYHYLWSQRRFNDAERIVGGLARRSDDWLMPDRLVPESLDERDAREKADRERLEAEIGGSLKDWRARPWWPKGWK